tara:strand:+ start:2175 stop:2672 length:498 start_codon:yes stop_codon:yes gene_type:complete
MWIVIKFDKKKINLLEYDLNNKIGGNTKIYSPRFSLEKFINFKKKNKQIHLLGDYCFTFNEKFSQTNYLNQVNYLRGVKCYLEGSKASQNEIISFIKYCKSHENEKGFLNPDFYKLYLNKSYKFFSGPFSNQIFKIISLQNKNLEILIGNLRTRIKKEKFLVQPI